MLLRQSAAEEKTVQIRTFSVGAGTTAELMPKRRFLAVRSRPLRRQLEKLGRKFEMRYVQAVGAGGAESLSTKDNQQHEWVVPDRLSDLIKKNYASMQVRVHEWEERNACKHDTSET